MKIYDLNLTGTSASEMGRTQESQKLDRSGGGKSANRAGSAGSTDSVEFSGTLAQLSRALSTFDSSRASQVQSLAAQYQSGNYRPDSLATSRGMIDEAVASGLQ